MKLHLHQDPEDTLNGYTNICIKEVDNINKALDDLVDDAEVTELVAHNILEFITLPDLTGFLEHMIQKIRHGGTLIITGVDAFMVAKDYVSYKISIEDFNVLIHGISDIKSATLNMHGMVNFLHNEFGLSIVRQNLEEYNYVIEAQRP